MVIWLLMRQSRRLLALACIGLAWFGMAAAEDAEVFVPLGHQSAITALATTPDGQRAASASLDGSVRLWSIASGRELRSIDSHVGSVLGVAFSPDGQRLASVGRDRQLRVTDATSGRALFAVTAHDNIVLAVAYSADGKRLITAGYDRDIKLWDAGNGTSLGKLDSTAAPPRGLTVSRDGAWLAVAAENGEVRLIDLRRGSTLRQWQAPGGLLGIAFSPDGRLLAGAGQDGSIVLWEVAEGREIGRLAGHSGAVTGIAFGASGELLASSGRDGTLRLWHVGERRPVRTLTGARGELHAVTFASGDRRILGAGQDRAVHVWDQADGRYLDALRNRSGEVRTIAFAPRGDIAAIGSGDGTLRLWDMAAGRQLQALAAHRGAVEALRFSADGEILASAGQDGLVHLWDWRKGRQRLSLPPQRGAVHALAFAPDGDRIASGGADGVIRLWATANAQPLRDLPGHTRSVRGLAWSPDGRRIASGGFDDHVRLWDADSGVALAEHRDHTNRVTAVAFTPDGQQLVSAGEDSQIRLRTLADGATRVFSGATRPLRALDIAADGKRLAAVGVDGRVMLWDITSGQPLATHDPHGGQLLAVAFGSSDSLLVGGDAGATVVLSARGGSERARLFGFEAKDWVAMVPAGHFAASDAGARFINVRLDGEVHALEQFVESFYRPDLVVAGLKHEAPPLPPRPSKPAPEAAATAPPAKPVPQPTPIVPPSQAPAQAPLTATTSLPVIAAPPVTATVTAVANTTPPPPASLSPSAAAPAERRRAAERLAEVKPAPRLSILPLPAVVSSEQVEVVLDIVDTGGGIGDVRLYLNGTAVVQDSTRNLKATAEDRGRGRYSVRLVKGRNQLRAIAFNADNSMQSEDVQQELVANFETRRKPSLHAIVVGIQEYRNQRLNLQYAIGDAELFAETLTRSTGDLFEKVSVKRLTTPANTTREIILATLAQARDAVQAEDLFVFYVASHGTVDGGDYFLITSNVGSTSSARLRQDAIGQAELRAAFANIPATKKFIVLDTCNAGQLGEAIQTALLTRGLDEDRATKMLARAVGSTVLSAATSQQEALEGYRGHGLFSFVVAEGLSGKADADGDGYVKTTEIADYVDNEVPELAEKLFRHRQYPIVSPSGQQFPLVKLR